VQIDAAPSDRMTG